MFSNMEKIGEFTGLIKFWKIFFTISKVDFLTIYSTQKRCVQDLSSDLVF